MLYTLSIQLLGSLNILRSPDPHKRFFFVSYLLLNRIMLGRAAFAGRRVYRGNTQRHQRPKVEPLLKFQEGAWKKA